MWGDRDVMTWFKVDDKLHAHEKAYEAGRDAMGLWVLAGSWSASQETDGFVPDSMLARIGGEGARDAAQALVDVGFWHDSERDGRPGYVFHDWGEYQPVKAQLDARRERERERVASKRRNTKGEFETTRGSVASNTNDDMQATLDDVAGNTEATTNGVAKVLIHPDPTRPDPSPNTSRKRDGDTDRFDEFWEHYPRKVAKGAAKRAWAKALKTADADAIIAAVDVYAKTMSGKERQFVAHPATWLNAERWEDDQTEPVGDQQGESAEADRRRKVPAYTPPPPPHEYDDDPRGAIEWQKEQSRRFWAAVDAGHTPKQGVALDENGDPQ